MTNCSSAIVKQLPVRVDLNHSRELFRELQPLLDQNRPCLVFDLSAVLYLDSAGVEILLRCTEEAMKRNGDIKLAAVSPQAAVILELTRVDRLFEIFEDPADAVESFQRFPVHAFQPTLHLATSAGNTEHGAASSQS